MSQKTEYKFLVIGGVSSIIIAVMCMRTLSMKGAKTDAVYYYTETTFFRMLVYLCWLIVQIIRSALYVSVISLSNRSKVDPSVVWFKADYDSPFARALLANSITLTPGTVTIEISDDGIYSVHALTGQLREGLLDGSMQQKVAWLYGEEIHFEIVETYEIPEEHRSELPMAGLKKKVYRWKRIS
jgi:multicomponent Na+:H+ antiporter subunit E